LEESVEKGNITYNFKQICKHADGIILIARNTTALEEVSLALEIEGRKMRLIISEKKIRYTKMSSTQARRYLQHLKTGDFKFEDINSFTYLGSVVNNENKCVDLLQNHVRKIAHN
jgi:hypothetical protein